MMRLFTVELRRLLARRAIRLLTLGAVVLVGVLVGTTAWNSQPPTEDELEFARQQVEMIEQDMQREVEFCEESPDDWGLSDADECEEMILGWHPRVEDFAYTDIFSFADEILLVLLPVGAMAFLLAYVIGASFVGAEWTSGMMGTHLTWEPRRGRVLVTKTLAATVVVAVVTAVLLAITISALYWVAANWGTADRTTDELVTDVVLRALRITGLAVAFAAFGTAVAGVLRSTVGALVAGGAYLAVGEGLIRAMWTGSDRWMLSHNTFAWLENGYIARRWDCSQFGGECEEIVTNITLVGGAAVLGAVIVAAVVLHAVTFARRDVV